MPNEPLDVARKGIEAYNRGDLDAIFELATEDVERTLHYPYVRRVRMLEPRLDGASHRVHQRECRTGGVACQP